MHKGKAKLSGVLHKGFKPDKCKTALRMAVARIKLLRNRKEAQVRQMRRELAQLLESDQDQTARIRVEHVIREEKMMAAYDLIEVYCELIVARLPIIESQKNCPIDLKEAIASVIFASMRCSDVTELMDVRKHFSAKYGKEFAAAALEVRPDSGVNRLVIEKLSAGAPDVQSKTKTLSSIAEEHNIKWEPKAFEEKLQKQNDLLYGSATYAGANIPTMGSSTYSMSMPQPTYSGTSTTTVESSTSHVPPAPASYSSAEIAGNRVAYNPANSNAFSLERGPSASIPPNSQYGATTYSSAENLGNEAAYNPANSNNSSHGNAGGSGLSRPHSQYVGPVSVSREEEVSQPRERKPSVSGSNWNMEFKDATSAAQAAAESAEMASLAARAAAQLASRGSFSAEKNTETYESPTYIHENTPRRQPVEHFMKDERKSFDEQRPGINDPRVINHAGSQYMSSTPSPLQSHSSGPTIHAGVYSMPTAQPPSHSSGSPIYDNLYEREDIIGKTAVHRFDLPEERLSDSGLGGDNIKDMESRQASFDQKNTNNYYSNFDSYHYPFSHDKTTIWGDHKDKSTGDSSGVVFDQYDSDGEERSTFRTHNKENLLDNFSSKHTEEYKHFEEQNRFSPNADRSEWLRSGSLVNDNTSTLFSRKEEQPSDNIGASSKDSRSPHSYDNVPPAFDSDGASSDEEEITTTRTAEKIRPHSSPSIGSSGVSGFTDEKKETEGANRIAEKLIPDIDESTEEYESMSTKKYQNNSTFDLYKKKSARSGESPKSVYSVVQGNVSHVQTSDSDLSEEETEHKLKGSSLDLTGAKENQSSSFSMQTSATSNEKYEGDLGLKFGKLTPGLRNKLRQPPYTKYSEDNVLQEQTLRKTPASITESVHSYENDTSPDQTANSPSSSRTTKTSFGASSSEELYDKMQVGARREDRSRMTRNYFGPDDAEKLSERTDNTPTSARTSKSSFGANSSQELYDDKPGVGAGREARSRVTRSYFDSDDSEEELERQQTVQTKWSREQKQSRRTREGTSDTKRDGVSRTGTESMPKEAKFPSESLCNAPTEEIAEAPMYSRVPVRRPSQMPVQSKHSLDRAKSQEADLTKNSVSENDGNPSTEALAGTPKESAPKAASHVHPKLPDYDSFAAHFQSLRVNRR